MVFYLYRFRIYHCGRLSELNILAGIPVEGKSSVCLTCINNYKIIIVITCVLSLSAWAKYCYRIWQTHHARAYTRTRAHTHARTHTCAHTAVGVSPPYRLSLFGGAQPTVTASSACDNAGRWRPDLPEVLEVVREYKTYRMN